MKQYLPSFQGVIQYSRRVFCFLRCQFSPWLGLAIALLKLLYSSGVQRTDVQIRYLSAINKINFVAVYGVLNDLLW